MRWIPVFRAASISVWYIKRIKTAYDRNTVTTGASVASEDNV
jgi:hypothetical protein